MEPRPDWTQLEGEVIIVRKFNPLATLKDGKVVSRGMDMPYAFVTINSPKLSTETVLPISHRVDFLHLWDAFKIRDLSRDEEILIEWSRKHDKWVFRFFSYFLPRLHVMLCPKGTYSRVSDPNWWKEAHGEAAFLSTAPIQQWNRL